MVLFGHKLCEICSKNRATIKLTRVDDGQVTEALICQSCAGEHSPLQKKSDEAAAGLQSLFANLLKEKSGEEAAAKVEPEPATCTACGMSFETYRKTFLLGCERCYESFEEALLGDLRKIHGDTRHVGKIPHGQERRVRQQVTVAELRRELNEAIGREDFERAAQLRDRIRALETGAESGGGDG
jgi:protein arginine kinase activator